MFRLLKFAAANNHMIIYSSMVQRNNSD